ncbi:MAG: PglZ domain-containing protein, partial [Anaerolineae bacterium]|nr:PglZ domain-containing protein [Anaerolineae bacterium]
MLIHALAERFARYFAQNSTHDTVIWFDPDQEYAGLLDHLTTASLWRYNGSLLALRHRLIHRTPGERAVVYLPMDKEDADLLRPFFATSDCFRDRLYRFLRHQGLAFPDDPNVDHQLRQLLPQLAVRSVGKGRQFWEYNLANLERAVNTLLGEFEGALLRFLDDPTRELTRLRQDQFEQLFFAELAGAYGLQATSDDDPDVVARDLTAELALARAYTDAGQPADFPFRDRLPQPHQVDRCLGFLDRWQHDARYAPAYARLAEKAGRLYSLDNWLESLPLADALQLGATFPDVEAVLWARLQGALAGLRSEADWSEWLAAHRHAIAARAGGFWAAHGRDPGWQVLVQAADLLREIEQMGRALPQVSRPGDMLQRYARDGWRVDAAYRAFRLALSMASGGLDPVRDRCARSYADALRAANERFSELLQSELAWPPAGALPAQDRFWAEAVGSSQKGKPFAVLFVDALRYELSEELLAQLEADRAGDSRALEARLATIPTVTPLGMAALLPDGHQRRVSHDGQWHVHIRDSGDLASKQARIDWLAGCLAGCETAFYNLNDLLDTPADRLDLVDCTVVFDTTLDAVGENADILAWDAFEPLIRSVKQGVHKLLDRGVETVHVVTDHGFLL